MDTMRIFGFATYLAVGMWMTGTLAQHEVEEEQSALSETSELQTAIHSRKSLEEEFKSFEDHARVKMTLGPVKVSAPTWSFNQKKSYQEVDMKMTVTASRTLTFHIYDANGTELSTVDRTYSVEESFIPPPTLSLIPPSRPSLTLNEMKKYNAGIEAKNTIKLAEINLEKKIRKEVLGQKL